MEFEAVIQINVLSNNSFCQMESKIDLTKVDGIICTVVYVDKIIENVDMARPVPMVLMRASVDGREHM